MPCRVVREIHSLVPGSVRVPVRRKLVRNFHFVVPELTPAGAVIGRESEQAMLAGLVKEAAAGRGGPIPIEGGSSLAGRRSSGRREPSRRMRAVKWPRAPVTYWVGLR